MALCFCWIWRAHTLSKHRKNRSLNKLCYLWWYCREERVSSQFKIGLDHWVLFCSCFLQIKVTKCVPPYTRNNKRSFRLFVPFQSSFRVFVPFSTLMFLFCKCTNTRSNWNNFRFRPCCLFNHSLQKVFVPFSSINIPILPNNVPSTLSFGPFCSFLIIPNKRANTKTSKADDVSGPATSTQKSPPLQTARQLFCKGKNFLWRIVEHFTYLNMRPCYWCRYYRTDGRVYKTGFYNFSRRLRTQFFPCHLSFSWQTPSL